jgi:hypothetical protein
MISSYLKELEEDFYTCHEVYNSVMEESMETSWKGTICNIEKGKKG